MKRSIIAVAVCSLLVAAVRLAAAADSKAGKKIYDSKCASCHAKDGSGNASMAKALKLDKAKLSVSGPETLNKSDEDLVKATADGVGKMPAFKGKLTPAQIDEVVAYMRSLAAPSAPAETSAPEAQQPAEAADQAASKKLYDAKCASCHGKNGSGNPALAKSMKLDPKALSLTGPESAAKTDEQLDEVIQKGKGKMPAYKSLSSAQLTGLIRYIRSLRRTDEAK